MTRTFLVSVKLPDDGSVSLEETVADIEDALDAGGVDFEEVKVWQSPIAGQTQPSGLQIPTTPPPPNPFV